MNDLPGSGWCHHPQRKVSSDVKILVRRSELACRDDWSRSLWQPATGQSTLDDRFGAPAYSGPVVPTSPEHLHAILKQDAAPSAPGGEDVLLSEGRLIAEPTEKWEPSPRPFPAGHFDPRTAIFKAREAHREKTRAKAAALRATAALEPSSEQRVHDETAGVAPEFDPDTLPERDGLAVAFGADEESPVVFGETQAADNGGDVQNPVGQTGSRELIVQGYSGGEPEGPSEARSYFSADDFSADLTEALPAAPEVPVFSAPDPAPDVSDAAEARRPLTPKDLPGWFRADLPRACRTCRDFRPGTEGQRGWCANKWAFTHRQLVQDDDVAPCHSAIGDWWVAVDDVWLVAADVSSHGRATPHLDRFVSDDAAKRRES